MKVVTNGKLVLPNKILEGYDLIIYENLIDNIIPSGQYTPQDQSVEVIDARGGHVAPGFIDIHADYIEHITAPRPTSLMNFSLALREAERELLTHGVTTMFHSLSLYKLMQADDKPIRRKENVEKFIDLIANTHEQRHLIRHRFHARFEVDNVNSVDDLIAYIEAGKVDMLSFMDHTPGQGQFSDIEAYKKLSRQYGSRLSDDEFEEVLSKRRNVPKLSHDDCGRIAAIAKKHHVAIASHDDDSIEKIDAIKAFGTTISEFPITLDIARHAHKEGLYTMAGAPNVLLGGSHSGNLTAHDAINEGIIDILCSDYYPAALLHSVYKMHNDFGCPLHEMFNLVTLNPARAVNIDDQVGSIEIGKRADLLIIEKIENDFPVITSCFVEGAHVFKTRYR